jgi:hypothetical protein
MDIAGEKEKRMPKKNVDGKSTSNHDNKERGIAFGFRKTVTAVKNTG